MADLHIRFSIDEQADKSYSQFDHDEILHKKYASSTITDSKKPETSNIIRSFKGVPRRLLFSAFVRKHKNSNAFPNISDGYKKAFLINKKAIIGLTSPEKLTVTGEYFQTTKIKICAENIFLMKKELGNKKNRQRSEKTSNIGFVTSTGFKPVTS